MAKGNMTAIALLLAEAVNKLIEKDRVANKAARAKRKVDIENTLRKRSKMLPLVAKLKPKMNFGGYRHSKFTGLRFTGQGWELIEQIPCTDEEFKAMQDPDRQYRYVIDASNDTIRTMAAKIMLADEPVHDAIALMAQEFLRYKDSDKYLGG
jgi:hypothetical protein